MRLGSLLLAVALCACASGSDSGKLNYGDNARLAYANALEEFYDDDCFEAEPLLTSVRREFPYSRFAGLAELRLADCHFREGRYAEAIQAYNQFVRYRPSHVEVPYARFMAAKANFEQIPAEWLLSPPAYERDQHYANESLRLLRRFLLDYPDDVLVRQAQRMAKQAIELLASHELYVAEFYFDRGHPKAAAGRLRTLLRSYPTKRFEAKALHLLAESYLQLNDRPRAKRAFEELLVRDPDGDYAGSARDALDELGS